MSESAPRIDMGPEIEKVRAEIKTIMEQVKWVLEHYPNTRSDDKLLILTVLRVFYPDVARHIMHIPFHILQKMPSFETITRCRRKLQEKGLYKPDRKEVELKRRIRQESFRQVMGKRKRKRDPFTTSLYLV